MSGGSDRSDGTCSFQRRLILARPTRAQPLTADWSFRKMDGSVLFFLSLPRPLFYPLFTSDLHYPGRGSFVPHRRRGVKRRPSSAQGARARKFRTRREFVFVLDRTSDSRPTESSSFDKECRAETAASSKFQSGLRGVGGPERSTASRPGGKPIARCVRSWELGRMGLLGG